MWQTIRISAAIVSPLLILGATAGYVHAILRGEVRPHRISWSLWLIVTCIGLAVTAEAGSGLGVVVPATYAFITAIVVGLAWTPWYGQKNKEKPHEKWIGLAALLLISIWPIFPLFWGVIIAIIGDSAAAWFTLKKSITDPQSEALWPWVVSCLGAFLGMFTIASYHFTATAFPAYLFLQTGLTALAIWWAHKKSGHHNFEDLTESVPI